MLLRIYASINETASLYSELLQLQKCSPVKCTFSNVGLSPLKLPGLEKKNELCLYCPAPSSSCVAKTLASQLTPRTTNISVLLRWLLFAPLQQQPILKEKEKVGLVRKAQKIEKGGKQRDLSLSLGTLLHYGQQAIVGIAQPHEREREGEKEKTIDGMKRPDGLIV